MPLLETASNLQVQDEDDGRAQAQDYEVEEQAVSELLPRDGPQQAFRTRGGTFGAANARARAEQGLALRLQVAHDAPADPLRFLEHPPRVQEAQATPTDGHGYGHIYVNWRSNFPVAALASEL